MPAIRNYEVTQTRTVLVCATNEVDALRVANGEFNGDELPKEIWGHKILDVSITDVNIACMDN